jgi:hypothetical protein
MRYPLDSLSNGLTELNSDRRDRKTGTEANSSGRGALAEADALGNQVEEFSGLARAARPPHDTPLGPLELRDHPREGEPGYPS